MILPKNNKHTEAESESSRVGPWQLPWLSPCLRIWHLHTSQPHSLGPAWQGAQYRTDKDAGWHSHFHHCLLNLFFFFQLTRDVGGLSHNPKSFIEHGDFLGKLLVSKFITVYFLLSRITSLVLYCWNWLSIMWLTHLLKKWFFLSGQSHSKYIVNSLTIKDCCQCQFMSSGKLHHLFPLKYQILGNAMKKHSVVHNLLKIRNFY